MGTWGFEPFENDAALDWVIALKRSRDREFPLDALRRVAAVGPMDGRDGEVGVAAAETVAASRGWPAESLPDGVWDWLGCTGGLAEAATVKLALRAIVRACPEGRIGGLACRESRSCALDGVGGVLDCHPGAGLGGLRGRRATQAAP